MKYLKNILPIGIGLSLLTSCGTTEYYSRPVEREPVVYRPEPAPRTEPAYNAEPQQANTESYQNPNQNYQDQGTVNYQTFYDALEPYGRWVQDEYYGYVWVPDVGPDFQPYQSRGHWVYTDFGWTWVSDYQWGWAPFHYGRWRFSDDYGWIWVPGYTWGPAWVAWRSSGTYYGWAPLGPPAPPRGYVYNGGGSGFRLSIGINFSFGDAPQPEHWCFVPSSYVASPQINNYYVDRSRNTNIYNNTTIINNVTNVTNINSNNTNINRNSNNTINNYGSNGQQAGYVAGPPRSEVERITGSRIAAVSVSNSARPGVTGVSGNSLSFYRPSIKAPSTNAALGANKLPAPRQAVQLNQVTPVYNRNTNDRGLISNSPASNLSSMDKNPVEAARQRSSVQGQNPNPVYNQNPNNRPVQNGNQPGQGQVNPNPVNNQNLNNRGFQNGNQPGQGQVNPNPVYNQNPNNRPIQNGNQPVQGQNPNPVYNQNPNNRGFQNGNQPGQGQVNPNPVNNQNPNNRGFQKEDQPGSREGNVNPNPVYNPNPNNRPVQNGNQPGQGQLNPNPVNNQNPNNRGFQNGNQSGLGQGQNPNPVYNQNPNNRPFQNGNGGNLPNRSLNSDNRALGNGLQNPNPPRTNPNIMNQNFNPNQNRNLNPQPRNQNPVQIQPNRPKMIVKPPVNPKPNEDKKLN